MAGIETLRMGKRGTVVLPSPLRKRLNLAEGSTLILEETEGGVLLRPAVVYPVETYTDLRKAEFLLNCAVDAADYAAAREEVQRMGLDPDTIEHQAPTF